MGYNFAGATNKNISVGYQNTPINLSLYMNVQTVSYTGGPYLFTKETQAVGYDFTVTFASNQLYVEVIRATTDTFARFAAPVTNAFVNLVITWDMTDPSTMPRVWYDGVEQTALATQVGSGAVTISATPWRIGGTTFGANGNFTCNGIINEPAMWDRLLDDGEIEALGKGYSPIYFRRGLIFYLPLIRGLDEYTGKTVTLTGTPALANHDEDIRRVIEF